MTHQTTPKVPHIQDLLAQRQSRRGVLGGAALLPALSLVPAYACAQTEAQGQAIAQSQTQAAPFRSVPENRFDTVTVPPGYSWQRLVSWGDPLFEGMAPADPTKRGAPFTFTRAEQEKRFGTYNDMIALFPATWSYPWPSTASTRYILCNNQEAVSPFFTAPPEPGQPLSPGAEAIEAMYAAMGVTVASLAHDPATGSWTLLKDTNPGVGVNRRVTPFSDVIFDGPAKNHPWIKVAAADFNAKETPKSGALKGRNIVKCGTMQNCAGGYTPWGTYLTAEENFRNQFFISDANSQALRTASQDPAFAYDTRSYNFGNNWRLGGPAQYDLSKNPHGTALYGWIVEIDPYDPTWVPRKRTMMGRKQHECATTVLTKDNRIASYMGDDAANEFVYKYVSRRKFNPANRVANRDILSAGKLYAARFEADGTGRWLELSLKAANAAARPPGATPFKDLGDVMVRAREAAARLGATPMDRPEDVESPVDGTFKGQGSVFVLCTANMSDTGVTGNAANPRHNKPTGEGNQKNLTGHIVRIDEDGGDHAATTFKWTLFAVAGDHSGPQAASAEAEHGVVNLSSWLNGEPTASGDRFTQPDNIAFDNKGFAYISTDGTPEHLPCNDGVYVVPIHGNGPRPFKRFLSAPVGAEVCGPLVSPDQKSFFCGIQHVGATSVRGKSYRGEAEGPYSSFPDGGWPRDSIIVVRKDDGGDIGT